MSSTLGETLQEVVNNQLHFSDSTKLAGRLAPYFHFTRQEWAALRANTPLDLSETDISELRGLNEPTSIEDVKDVYLPLSRLLNLHFTAARSLSKIVENAFLGRPKASSPYVIGIAGSVAVGKSTFARLLQAVLGRWLDHPRVDLVTTDGFLYPKNILEQRDLMQRKGFPESYDLKKMLAFLTSVKTGSGDLQVPMYSHQIYDRIPGSFQTVSSPDILIFEGLNVLQTNVQAPVVASDFFDFSIYLDSDPTIIEEWYVARFLLLQATAFQNPSSYFYRYSTLNSDQTEKLARNVWNKINLLNLLQNIQPSRERANLVIRKGESHAFEEFWLRPF